MADKMIQRLKRNILQGHETTKTEAIELIEADLEELCRSANEIRQYFCGNDFDVCTIINGKSGRCSEDCKYCAQSAHYQGEAETCDLLGKDEILQQGLYDESKGVSRYSIVTSGRTLDDKEEEKLCETYQSLRENCRMSLCASHGLLTFSQIKNLKDAGITRYHNNLESSRRYFPQVCTTHSYDDKIKTLKEAEKAGLSVCSGGIMGMGETMEDRIDLAIDLRAIGVDSVPVNMLNPIKGTPYEGRVPLEEKDMRRIIAIFRFILPKVYIRLAGGRGLLKDKGYSCFLSGANAVISGDMLTTAGIDIESDMRMIKDLGFEVKRLHG